MERKRLRKSSDKKIFGVCAGVAEYLDIDPTIVRVVWAVAILFYGTGLLLYLIMAIVMPGAQTGPAGGSGYAGTGGAEEEEEDILVEVRDAPEEDDEKK